MKCKICRREAHAGAYCPLHGAAYNNLEKGYEMWRYALGLTWVQYLERLNKINGTGKLIKEIVTDLLG